MQTKRSYRPIGALDVAASALLRLAPRPARATIEQARHDARSVLDGLLGRRTPSFSSATSPALAPRPLADIDPIFEVLPRGLGRRYQTLQRDVAMLTLELRGKRPSPLVARAERPAKASNVTPMPRPSSPPPAMPAPSLATRPMRVASITRETLDAVTITLEPLDGKPFVFRAGQFLTFHVKVGGVELRRAYSLCTSPIDTPARRSERGGPAITVKRIADGRVSRYMNESLAVGDVLEVFGPSGTFCAPRDAQRLVMWAGGSGITPVWSIVQTVLARDPSARVTLVYGNRSESEVIFCSDIDALAEEESRLEVVHVLERPAASWTGRRGVLDRAMVAQIAGGLDGLAQAHHFVCGPAPMMDAVREELRARGVLKERLHEERFASPADRSSAMEGLPKEAHLVTLRRGGTEQQVRVEPTQTILEAATAAGFPLPFSCAMGGCAACKCKVKAGRVHMEEPNCLSDEEKAEGWVLTCIGHPVGETRLEVS